LGISERPNDINKFGDNSNKYLPDINQNNINNIQGSFNSNIEGKNIPDSNENMN
jgi:hypothetical protein